MKILIKFFFNCVIFRFKILQQVASGVGVGAGGVGMGAFSISMGANKGFVSAL